MNGFHFNDRRIRTDERPLLAIALVWMVAAALLVAMTWGKIVESRMPDPDDLMRLVQVRDLVNGQGWFDLHQYRLGDADGTLMHWSRLVDAPLALIVMVLRPFLGQYGAETAAMVFMPLLLLGLCIAVVGMLAWRLHSREVAVIACLCLVFYPLFTVQVQPMRIDHHAYQILSLLVAVWALSRRNAWRGGAIAGLSMAVGLTVSLELLPMAAAIGAVLFLRWLRDTRDRVWLAAYMQALASGLAVLFLATRGLLDLIAHCDVIAPSHLAFFGIAAVGTSVLAAFGRLPLMRLFAGFAVTGAIGAAVFAASAPDCLGSPFGNLDPLVRELWYLNIREGLPIWVFEWDFALPALIPPVAGLVASLMLAARSSDWLRRWWADYSILLALALLAGILTSRSMGFAGALAAIPLGWLVVKLVKAWSSRSIAKRVWAPLAIMGILVPMPFAAAAKVKVDAWTGNAQPETTRSIADTQCDFDRSMAALDRLPTGTVFGFFDIGPEILRGTRHRVVASSHHRADQAMHDVILAFSSPPDTARRIIAARNADYIVLCSDLPETVIYADRMDGENALIDGLLAGRPPVWAEPVAVAAPDAFKVWRVRP